MKILQINSVCGTGSTGRIATGLYDAYIKQGHKCVIAYGRGVAPDGYDTIKIGNKFNILLHGIVSRLTDRHGTGSFFATKRLVKKIKEYAPDVIHLHNIHGYYLNIKVLFDYLSKADIPVVWTLHDCWAFTGHCAYFDYAGCDKWETGCFECLQLESYPKSVFKDNSRINYDQKKQLFTSVKNMTLVTPSQWLAGLVERSFLGKYPVKVINNGIDLSKFKPTDSDFREKYGLEEKIIILGVANIWDKRKGLNDFIELRKLLDEKYQIVLVGLSDKQIKGLPCGITGIRRTAGVEELAQIYTASDVFVNPSVEETMGLVTVEALACGTPVITYNKTAVPEMVGELCGVVSKTNSPEEIKSIIANYNKAVYTGTRSFAENFGCEIKYNEYIDLIGMVIDYDRKA